MSRKLSLIVVKYNRLKTNLILKSVKSENTIIARTILFRYVLSIL